MVDMRRLGRLSRSYVQLASRLGVTPVRLTAYWLGIIAVLIVTFCVRSASTNDPGSLFFNPDTAYIPRYSAVRQMQAERFIAAASIVPPLKQNSVGAPLCIGIPSIARQGARYLRTTVGSLLTGLTQGERDGIHLIVFIPHTDPTVHPAYQESWLSNLADEVLLYDLPRAQFEHVQSLELEHELHREKGLFDYTYLLKACYAREAPYIAIIEDDVIAMDGWYHRTVAGIRQAEKRSALEKASQDFLYLRMFHTEEYLGWNSEDWVPHVFWSFAAIVGAATLVFTIRAMFPDARSWLTPYVSVAICLIVVPWTIVLVFAAGRVTVFPLPDGISEMNKYGCCAQGLVYPRSKAYELIQWFTESRIGFADMLTEQYADAHDEQRWALTPSVLQHIGSKSSKSDDFGHGAKYAKSVAENIWNFGFESNDPKALRKEHELAAINPVSL